MRVSSLSDAQVIELISKYFVPAWASRDHYQQTDFKAEQEELLRIDRSKEKNNLPGGVVCVYLLAPDGEVYATLPVQQAWKPDKLIPVLKDYIDKEKLKPRDADAVKAGTAPPPPPPKPKADGAILIHVWTRIDEKTGVNRGVGSDLVELTADQWKAFLPAKDAKAGDTWKVAPETVDALYEYFYPPLPHWNVKESKLVSSALTATVVSTSEKEVNVRLEGDLDLIYPFTGKPTDAHATGKLTGYVRVDPEKRTLTAFALASEDADFVGMWDGKAQPRKMRIAAELEPKDN
jgi:hypothetical protein